MNSQRQRPGTQIQSAIHCCRQAATSTLEKKLLRTKRRKLPSPRLTAFLPVTANFYILPFYQPTFWLNGEEKWLFIRQAEQLQWKLTMILLHFNQKYACMSMSVGGSVQYFAHIRTSRIWDNCGHRETWHVVFCLWFYSKCRNTFSA